MLWWQPLVSRTAVWSACKTQFANISKDSPQEDAWVAFDAAPPLEAAPTLHPPQEEQRERWRLILQPSQGACR